MNVRRLVFLVTLAGTTPAFSEDDFALPPEVTPSLRAACEADVRRLCVGENPTVEKVKFCVQQKYAQLGSRCKMQLAASGLTQAATNGFSR